MDANNQYGWAMIQKLRTYGFLWKKAEDLTPEKIDELVKKDTKRSFLEADVEYPKELHENLNELPFLADRMKIGRKEKLVSLPLGDKKGSTDQKTESSIKA